MDIRIAAYAVIIDDGRILLAHWNEHGRNGWTLPGGGIEGAEHPIEAVRREVFEETGMHVEVERQLGIDRMIVPAERRHEAEVPLYALRVLYRGTVIGGELRPEVGGSSDDARWVPLDEVAALKRVSIVDIALAMNEALPLDGAPERLARGEVTEA